MEKEEKMAKCLKFFNELAELLKDDYVVISSCNKDASAYLVPKGTESDISYYGKPVLSFRVSDHWNWYSNTKKCSDPEMVQCESVDLPKARKRLQPGMATRPIFACQVAVYLDDGKYYGVYGECYTPKKKYNRWEFIDNVSPKAAAAIIKKSNKGENNNG